MNKNLLGMALSCNKALLKRQLLLYVECGIYDDVDYAARSTKLHASIS